jgi:hypothetical protein
MKIFMAIMHEYMIYYENQTFQGSSNLIKEILPSSWICYSGGIES